MREKWEVFGSGQITLENGSTIDVAVITTERREELAYVSGVAEADMPKCARLIAAAPDLLDALQVVNRRLESITESVINNLPDYKGQIRDYLECLVCDNQTELRQARQALAKATGQD